ncbi:unnamed protein product [Periconia digitata]|uniref:Uncharacterized protein n=1 Tax=Periconia digitata TaxID=1303443 RepID=A0A9W4XLP6_9PLEO|nr:unnamed protein product [Periconia digitata]
MTGYQFIQRASLFLAIAISNLVSSTPLPDIAGRDDWIPGPYALRLVSNHPNLTNAFLNRERRFQENPALNRIQPIWGGPSYFQSLQPNATDNLYERGGAIFLDERRNNTDSMQLIMMYIKLNNQREVPYLSWSWEYGPGVTHLWPGNYYVSWGGFQFVKQSDSGRTFMFVGNGTDPKWRWAAQYLRNYREWDMVNWNSTDPSAPLPEDWEFVNVEVVPFEQLE